MRRLALPVLAALATATPAPAYVDSVLSLQYVIAESQVIAEAKVEKVDKENQTAELVVGRSLKGKCHYERIRMNLGVGQAWHPEAIRRHLVPGAPAIVFYNAGRQSQTYLNRFFFQLYGDPAAPPEKAWWNFTHVEVKMNRTFNGPVPELAEIVEKVLAGRAKPPPPDEKLPIIEPLHLRALPGPLEPVRDETALPAPFVRRALLLGKPREPLNPPDAVPGLCFEVYEGSWTALPDFAQLKPVKSGTAPQPDVEVRGRETAFALRFTGFLDVPRDGTWTFSVASNDGSKLFVAREEVVDNDHHHGVVEKSGILPLKAGKHPFAVVYFQDGGHTALEVHWEGPGTAKQRIPAGAFFSVASIK
jgi:hypothetical protein